MTMKTSDFNYELPQELIAQDPLDDRSASRLMVLDRETGAIEHRHFYNIVDYLNPEDCLVINNTKVIPARLYGNRILEGDALASNAVQHHELSKEEQKLGALIEVLLLRRRSGADLRTALPASGQDGKNSTVWECLVRPGKKVPIGTHLIFGDGLLTGEVTDIVEEGNRLIRFTYEGIFEEILDQLGQMPLPPYIKHELKDKDRYQTVYAKEEGSAAAPTAGLHFTPELLDEIRAKGVRIAEITLHVGLGTFRPVKVEDVTQHHMHSEFYQIPEEAARVISETKAKGGRVICVGTTCCRTLETAAKRFEGKIQSCSGWTDIFIYPGFEFQVMDALITNFHLPESTLLMLVSAFAGKEKILEAYRIAVQERYRFFSFGDAMLIR